MVFNKLQTPVFYKRLAIALLIFTLCRVLFFFFNKSYFQEVSPLIFLSGIRFDSSTIVFLFSPFITFSLIPLHFKSIPSYQKFLKILFHIPNVISVTLNCIDLEYFKFTLKRTTSDVFNLIGFGNDFISLVPRFALDFWYVLIIWFCLIAFSIFLYKKTEIESNKEFEGKRLFSVLGFQLSSLRKYYFFEIPVFLILFSVFIVGGRGGFQLRPIDIINANDYASPQNVPLVLNTPFTIIKTLFDDGIKEKNYFKADALKNYFNPVKQFKGKSDFKPLNVVVIIMESFSNEYIGVMNSGIKRETYTPFLDSLSKFSLVFDRCFANGKKSIEGIPSILASLPSLMNNPFISSAYSGNKINSIASILKEKGYQTGFFHGGTNGTMGFDAFSKAAGFDKYYGRNEYNNDADYDGHWGIYDEEFFQFFTRNLNEFREPFLGCFFSLSSHHPFTIPLKYNETFNKGTLKIHPSIQYADFALKRFFETAEKCTWFKNTVFIITSDHTSTTSLPFFNSSAGIYSIPLLIYSKDRIVPGLNHRFAQQIDIMPSILDLLNYGEKFNSFGQSIFSEVAEGYSISFMNNIYQLVSENRVLEFDGENFVGCYDFKSDQLLKNNILAKDSTDLLPLKNMFRAFIQSYNYSLINNKLLEK